eukprot:CAMPEP_0176088804 /NCGR_PEP_ID=MMETSP0120_2-20121206/44466_1 /TAXON_ID=160619 /ORGANISM="Kryptoperidinium foliaceum, Strain CCMP 1326" /LENGTH=476 /DNA_ID=CAMNT_0017422665 /DNA_START=35 /DNA_END=1465 /DNA_ORIENTATION=+
MTLITKPLLESPLSPLGSPQPECERACSHAFGEELNMGSTVSSMVCAGTHVGSASLSVARANLVLAVLGAGQLTLPYALGQLGIVFGLMALVLFTGLSVLSLRTLAVYELHFTPGPTDCLESYSELVVRVLGRPGSMICTFLLAGYAWGGALSFMIILKSEFGWLADVSGVSRYVGDLSSGGSAALLAVSAMFLWPVSSLVDLSALKRFSPLGCLAAVFVTVVSAASMLGSNLSLPSIPSACSGASRTGDLSSGLMLWPTSWQAVAASMPLFSFALNSSWAFIPILCTLHDKTDFRVGISSWPSSLILSSNAIIFLNYSVLSVSGYWMFCDSVEPNILDSLGEAMVPGSFLGNLVASARVAVAIQLTLALPMRFFVARQALVPNLKRFPARLSASALLVGSAAVLAIMPLSLATVLGLVSSVCASFIIYILPAYVDLKLRLSSTCNLVGSGVSLLTGIFVLFGGCWANLAGVSVGS